MVQTWVLRVGHHSLKVDHAAFVAALNGVSDWTTVACEEGLSYDGTGITRPNFITTKDCAAFEASPPALDCSNSNCETTMFRPCCQADCSSPCCALTPEYDELCAG